MIAYSMRNARSVFIVSDGSGLNGACYHGRHYYSSLVVILGEP